MDIHAGINWLLVFLSFAAKTLLAGAPLTSRATPTCFWRLPMGKAKKPVQLPPELDTTDFRQAWSDWEQYRAQRNSKLTKITVQRQLAKLCRWADEYGPDYAVSVLDQSMDHGWLGIWHLKIQDRPVPRTTQEQKQTIERKAKLKSQHDREVKRLERQQQEAIDTYIDGFKDDELEQMLTQAIKKIPGLTRFQTRSEVPIRESRFKKALIYNYFVKDLQPNLRIAQ